MYTYDVLQIVDVYRSFYEGRRQTRKFDPDAEAQSLSMLAKALGRNDRKIAIVAQGDERRLSAFQRAGYETHMMNGNRPEDLRQFIIKMKAQIKQAPPNHVVLVTDDPEFVHLCDGVTPPSRLAVWTNSPTPPRELTDPSYGWRPLEELLPNLKISRIDVRIDLENIFIGLVQQRGWRPNLNELIESIRLATEDLGEVVAITGYADFDELNRHHGSPNQNWQRALTLAGGDSRYVVNQHGKNTADMKIADDIRTVVEHDAGAGGAIDIIALATMDRDFRHIVDTAKSRGKKVVVLALEGGLSRELERAASEVRYLDKYLKLGRPDDQGAAAPAPARPEDVALMLRVAATMHRNRWRFVERAWLEQEYGHEGSRLREMIDGGWFVPGGALDAQGQPRRLEPNRNDPTARAAHYLARWIPERLDNCLHKRGMQYVDSNYMASGMQRDPTLSRLGIGQTRAAAENWLRAAERAGLVAASEMIHPQNPTKVLTTWRLPSDTAAPSAVPAPNAAPDTKATNASNNLASSGLRQMLTEGLSDAELTRVLFDYFRPVHRDVEGAPKYARIQALLDYVERCELHAQLLAAVREVNPALGEREKDMPLAA